MDFRPYFLIGDLLANAAVGALAAVAVAAAVGDGWPMLLAMVVGMVLGMLVGLVASLTVLTPLLGAMEVMVPAMLVGMLAGMAASMIDWALVDAARNGALIGLATIVVVGILNSVLKGSQRVSD